MQKTPTATLAREIHEYNPDKSWTKVTHDQTPVGCGKIRCEQLV